VKVFRICAAQYGRSRKQAFSGVGGLRAGARWHTRGRRIVYCAQSLSLAALEMLVHLKTTVDVGDFVHFEAEIPDDLILCPASYPGRWRTDRVATRRFGDAWLTSQPGPALLVPSVISPGEWNVLLNPAHPVFSPGWITAGPRTHVFDERLLR
jgi:RES domain-containing protein